jgi:phosphopantetheinyl transferase
MAQLFYQNIKENLIWGIWEIEEEENTLISLLPKGINLSELEQVKHERRRMEWLSARVLALSLAKKIGIEIETFYKDEYGKPYLLNNQFFISISHAKQYAVVILQKDKPVGIDIEIQSEKVSRSISRVCKSEEIEQIGNDERRATIFWCAKEALYKYYGKKKLDFKKDIHVQLVNEHLSGKIFTDLYTLAPQIGYQTFEEYMIVYCF